MPHPGTMIIVPRAGARTLNQTAISSPGPPPCSARRPPDRNVAAGHTPGWPETGGEGSESEGGGRTPGWPETGGEGSERRGEGHIQDWPETRAEAHIGVCGSTHCKL